MNARAGQILCVPTSREDLKQDSDILINQIRTLSKIRIKEKIAKLTDDEYNLVIENLCKNFH